MSERRCWPGDDYERLFDYKRLFANASWRSVRRTICSSNTWCVLATVDFVLTSNLRPLFTHLGDPDDAVRLVSVREFLHGAPWFDTTLPRIGAPEPLVSHWSRFIDTPLALLIGGLTPVLRVRAR